MLGCSLRRLLFGLGATATALGFAAPVQAEVLHARYTVTIIGLPVGTAGLNGFIAPNSYRLDLNARLVGIADLLASFKGAATAAGNLYEGRVLPTAYATSTSNSYATHTVRMAMSGGTVRGIEITPPIPEVPDRVPLLPAHKRNVVDPMSALLMPMNGGAELGPAACDRTLPVFDGYARFNIEMSYSGRREVKTKGYSGPAAVCAVHYTPIAGHRASHKPTQFMADNHDIETWLVPVGNTHLLAPYRIAVRTMIGMTVIEASEFSVDGAKHAAALPQ